MYTSLCGMWVGGIYREVHNKCKKDFIDAQIIMFKNILKNLKETRDAI